MGSQDLGLCVEGHIRVGGRGEDHLVVRGPHRVVPHSLQDLHLAVDELSQPVVGLPVPAGPFGAAAGLFEMCIRDSIDSLMDDKFRESTFDTFHQTKNNARNLRLCRRYAEAFPEMVKKNQGLLMYGNVGTGKTFAAACIANYLLDRKVPTVMTSFVKIVDSADLKNRETANAFISRLNRARLLIIDDLGAERGTDYALERVYDICLLYTSSRHPERELYGALVGVL